MRLTSIFAVAVFGLTCAALPAVGAGAIEAEKCESCEAALKVALADPHRAEDRWRDENRKPAETLSFFRVQPGMTVVEIMPGGGWYTRILVPYLGEQGRYIGLNPNVAHTDEKHKRSLGNLAQTLPPKVAAWTGVAPDRIGAYNSDSVPAALNGTVDRVLILRAMHTYKEFNMVDSELQVLRKLLKPDGLLGVEQHRARADAPDSYAGDGKKGYLRESDVIRWVEAQGFELVGKSEANANPRDPADHVEGVWTLAPAFRLGDKDRAKYEAIGESDRMTLLFRKKPE